ncbi:MAG: class I SAM-dependent methyltransferase [Anaerolineales bacterium]|nr:class I SAM-dependent methyltransferase [Anaerolineales bacterium]
MQSILFILVGLICIVIVISIIWRFFSNRASIPCPSWLGWLVELDNPILKNNSAREIVSHLELQPGMKVLDFGCGPGRITIPVAKQVGPSGTVTAFDIQAAMLERVRAKAVHGNLGNIEFIQGAAGEGKLGNNQYDRVLLVTVLGEIPDRKALLKEISDCLKSGGLLSVTEAIADPHFQTRKNVLDAVTAVGLKEKGLFGNRISFTMILEKP